MANINLFIDTFAGLHSKKTLVVPVSRDASASDVWQSLYQRLPFLAPENDHRFILSTLTSGDLLPTSNKLIREYLSTPEDEFLSLRIWTPLCGGKGGFGSQLRAAGGRMSSKKKKTGDENASSRNLDGRRIRTVNEAKNLAKYLKLKPEMEKKEREQRKERLTQVIEQAERRRDEIINGGRGTINEAWRDSYEESIEKTKEAVSAAMKEGYNDNLFTKPALPTGSPNSGSSGSDTTAADSGATTPEAITESVHKTAQTAVTASKGVAHFGFDDGDEFLSSDEE